VTKYMSPCSSLVCKNCALSRLRRGGNGSAGARRHGAGRPFRSHASACFTAAGRKSPRIAAARAAPWCLGCCRPIPHAWGTQDPAVVGGHARKFPGPARDFRTSAGKTQGKPRNPTWHAGGAQAPADPASRQPCRTRPHRPDAALRGGFLSRDLHSPASGIRPFPPLEGPGRPGTSPLPDILDGMKTWP
jgi:hypothetical protein